MGLRKKKSGSKKKWLGVAALVGTAAAAVGIKKRRSKASEPAAE